MSTQTLDQSFVQLNEHALVVGTAAAAILDEESIYLTEHEHAEQTLLPLLVNFQRRMMAEEGNRKADRVQAVLKITETLLSLSDSEVQEKQDPFMDLLAGAHLTLYFLGFTFSHAWTRVRKVANKAGGYPRGVCIYKANGDVYRLSRQILNRDAAVRSAGTVLVHTREPVFLSSYSDVVSKGGEFVGIAGLGYLYNLFQALLYVAEKHPIRYVMRQSAIGDPPSARTTKRLEAVCRWAATGQDILLVGDDVPSTELTGCVLGHAAGFSTPADTRANHLKESQLAEYREAVANLASKGASLRNMKWASYRPQPAAVQRSR